jgi:hypothetical protein
MQKTITLLFVLAAGCAPAVAEPTGNPCEAVRPAYNDALASLHEQGYACTDGFDAFGCLWTAEPTTAQVMTCEELLSTHATSCAALQNALWECEGGNAH